MVALVTKPTRSSSVFEIVAECRLPSSVTGQLDVWPSGSTNSSLAQVARMLLVLLERWLAEVLLTSRPNVATAPIRLRSVRGERVTVSLQCE